MFRIECRRVLLEWKVHKAKDKKGGLGQRLCIEGFILFWTLFCEQEEQRQTAFFLFKRTTLVTVWMMNWNDKRVDRAS